MLTIWDDIVNDLHTWAEVEDYLSDDWYEVHDRVTGLAVTDVDILLVDEPPSGTAAQRRLLHRAGFRRVRPGAPQWSWTPPERAPADVEAPPMSATVTPRIRATLEAWQRDLAQLRARNRMAVYVLKQVYQCAPANLSVVLPLERDEDDDDWDDDARMPHVDDPRRAL
jgi:hypothetical protein